MRKFELVQANSFEEAARLKGEKADVMAGGTDLLNVYKHAILEEHPEVVVSLDHIPGEQASKKKTAPSPSAP